MAAAASALCLLWLICLLPQHLLMKCLQIYLLLLLLGMNHLNQQNQKVLRKNQLICLFLRLSMKKSLYLLHQLKSSP